MPSVGPQIAGTGANLAGIGTAVWIGATNITVDDALRATANVNAGISNYLRATNFDFSTIPDNAIILGVECIVQASFGSGTVNITNVTFIVANAAAGTAKTPTQAISGADTNYTFGSPTDLWGYAITPALLKTSTTGFAVSMTGSGAGASARADVMWMKVYYEVPTEHGPIPGVARGVAVGVA